MGRTELWIGPRESHRAFDPSLRLLRAAECGELEVLSQLLNHHAANVNATGIVAYSHTITFRVLPTLLVVCDRLADERPCPL